LQILSEKTRAKVGWWHGSSSTALGACLISNLNTANKKKEEEI
jgi:hypothetical protein